MDMLVKAPAPAASVAILSGSFHPITVAHLALARTALQHADEVLLVMPRRFPHKDYDTVSLEDRMLLVCEAIRGLPGWSAGISDGGLFLEIAREARPHYGPQTRLWFVCGRDAAERILEWDYSCTLPIERQLDEYGLLVAGRQGRLLAPPHLAGQVRAIELEDDFDHVSSSEVRRRLARGEPWRHLVPAAVEGMIEDIYRRA